MEYRTNVLVLGTWKFRTIEILDGRRDLLNGFLLTNKNGGYKIWEVLIHHQYNKRIYERVKIEKN